MKNFPSIFKFIFLSLLLAPIASGADSNCLPVDQETFQLIKNQTTSEEQDKIIPAQLAKFSKEDQTKLLDLSFTNQSWNYAQLLISNHVHMNDAIINKVRKQYGVETALFYQKMQEAAIKEKKKRQRECRNCLTATAASGTGSTVGILTAASCVLM